MAEKLRKAGLDEITLSLNTLDGDKYRRLTLGELCKPLEGIDAVFRAGFPRLKINCVPLDAESREDAVSIAALARDRNILTRFIEMMPIGAGSAFPGASGALVLQWLEAEYGPWELRGDVFGPGPARYGSFRGFTGMAGFINPLSEPFCGSCNRIRLSSGGFIRSCLHREEGIDLRPALEKKDNRKLEEDIRLAILHKPQGHRFGLLPAEGPGMFQIGG
jgi:cyclic pyranopterin phosphate synthase